MPQPEDYTIGWICAIRTEYVAARQFLDEEHEGPRTVSPNDSNAYTLGKMREHNVVIAVLPDGQYGVSSATGVIKDMIHTFPNIRIGLMVGIGGGAPSTKHDIRLGDVVVSAPRQGKGGVFQYDFGKTIQDQSFRTTGFMNHPPAVLLTAATVLSGQYESDGHNLERDISNILEKKPRLRKAYGRPDPNSDRLYKSRIIHPKDNEMSCEAICDNPENLVERRQRTEDEDNPAIHYGLIASANQLMKDALVRDKLAAEEGVLCFEMEAAGLMNHFPCLVVRGICDYSDSHKNKEWQGYAAMVAAAYAKDLLGRVAPSRVQAETKLSNALSGLYDVATAQLEITRQHVQAQKDFAKQMLTQHEQRCHQQFRLTASDRDITYEWYKNRVEERVEGTCLWFLEHEHFQGWLKQNSGPLLVTADPGCGKSVLARYLIDHGLPRSVTICYFFFKDEDQKTARQMLCALLHQLFSQHPALIKHAMRQYEKDGESLTNSTDSLWEILRSSVRDPQAGSVTIVLDALDECAQTEFEALVRNIEAQFHSNDPGNAKLRYLLTCRPYEQLVSRFSNLLGVFPNIHIPGEENSETISQEVNRVITHRVYQLPNNISPEIKSHLEKRLHLTSHRTYLWVYLVFDYLKDGSFKKTRKGVDSAISNLPRSVNEAYEQILNRSNAEERQMVRKVLSIVLAASQPLTLKELNIATNIDYETKSLEDIDLEDEDDFKKRIRSWCGLFILISQGHVYFLHQTAREFLIADSSSTPPVTPLKWEHSITIKNAQAVLAELCVLCLAFAGPEVTLAIDGYDDQVKFMNRQPFFFYSALNWGAHFRHAKIAEDAAIIPIVLKICDPSAKSYLEWFNIYWGTKHYGRIPQFSHLMVAAYYGHHLTMKLILKKDANLNSKDDIHHRTPLHWAAFNGHKAAVELLIDKGADLDSKDRDRATPLLLASSMGHEAVAKLLIDNGAELDSKESSGRTPLLVAASQGHEAVAKLMIDKGADLDSKNHYYHAPVLLATFYGHEAIAKLLIEKGADVNFKAFNGQTTLSVAAKEGREAIFNLLLVTPGIDIDSKDNCGRTPLSYAAMAGHDTMVEALISNERVKIDGEDSYGSTPTSLAARHNCTQVIKRLLGTGRVDPNSLDHSGRTPLWYAKRYANPDIVKLLFQHARNSDIASDRKVFPTPGMGTMRNKRAFQQCDACTLFIYRGYKYYNCDICNKGDFDLCSDCHGLGVRCLGVGHQMTKKSQPMPVAPPKGALPVIVG
ncbi:unnamed protein product [Clonostachys rhizophaga]|uniref:Nucleoside phosphorylase domain-containing protein n=1 Tax=Clonostachys rhizophaga TaxID=160324 RepID=A0A9N9VZ35_9HYPO|nr:unnamed protein product [Clonostachys rhizophaga]